MAAPVYFEWRMNVIRGGQGGFVLIPGCEPCSALTSTRLYSEMQRAGLCDCSVVSVRDVLEAIPGSRVIRLSNTGHGGGQREILVLPPFPAQSCPSVPRPDYYATLRSLCRPATEEELEAVSASGCDSFSLNPCEKRVEWRGQL